jgi:DNA-binding XRE family transcriptional regulator
MRNIIKEARLNLGLSQVRLAQEAGLSYNTVAFAERGKLVSPKTARRLSRLLGVRILPVVSEKYRLMVERRYAARRASCESQNATANLPCAGPSEHSGMGTGRGSKDVG